MKIVVYLHHPAQFHLFKRVIKNLLNNRHVVKVFATKKDVLEDLLQEARIPYTNFVPEGKKDNKISTAFSMIRQDFGLFKYCLLHRPDLMIGTSAEIAHVGFVLGIPNIFVNEDDVSVVPLVGKVIHPFAKHLLAPDVCDTGNRNKTISYPSYHELAYLHPDNFTPDRNIAASYIDVSKKSFLIRFAKLTAHHDTGIRGIDPSIAEKIIRMLEPHGNVYITSERPLESQFEKYRMPIRSADIHHVMAFSDIYIGDSQTMAAEAGCLGVPFIRCNDFVGRIGYLRDLEDHYGLGFGISPSEPEKLIDKLQELLNFPDIQQEWTSRKIKMLADKIELSGYITRLIENYPESINSNIQISS
jgi:predicted glycosyltransferase